MHPIVRRILVLGPPLALSILTWFHPSTAPIGVSPDLVPQVNWWLTLHLLQLPLFCLLGLSAYLLLEGVEGALATIGRIAIGIFVIFYPALDTIQGISTGILVENANGLPSGFQQLAAVDLINQFFSDRTAGAIGDIASLGWAIGILCIVLALARPNWSRSFITVIGVLAALAFVYYQANHSVLVYSVISGDNLSRLVVLLAVALAIVARPSPALGLLLMSGYLFAMSHVPWPGPIAMACFFIAALQLEFFPEKMEMNIQPPQESDELPSTDAPSFPATDALKLVPTSSAKAPLIEQKSGELPLSAGATGELGSSATDELKLVPTLSAKAPLIEQKSGEAPLVVDVVPVE